MTIVLNVTVTQSFNPFTLTLGGRGRALRRRERLALRGRRRGFQMKAASNPAPLRPAFSPESDLDDVEETS